MQILTLKMALETMRNNDDIALNDLVDYWHADSLLMYLLGDDQDEDMLSLEVVVMPKGIYGIDDFGYIKSTPLFYIERGTWTKNGTFEG